MIATLAAKDPKQLLDDHGWGIIDGGWVPMPGFPCLGSYACVPMHGFLCVPMGSSYMQSFMHCSFVSKHSMVPWKAF